MPRSLPRPNTPPAEASEREGFDPLLKPDAVARWLAVSKSTLVRWRQTGYGPPAVWLTEDLPRYRASDVQAWLDTRAA